MKKHLFLKSLLIAIGLLIASINTAWAAETYVDVYLYTGQFTNWENDGATFKVGTGDDATGTTMTSLGNHWYKCNVATGSKYIKRCSSDGNTKWNKFGTISISTTNYVVKATGWDAGSLFTMGIAGDGWNSIGSWSNNNSNGKMTPSGSTFSKSFTNVAASAHLFKIVEQGTWDRARNWNSGTVTGVNCAVQDDGSNDHNIQFTPYIATGTTTITYDVSTGEITVTCPKIPITLDKNGGTSAGSATVDVGASSLSTISHASRTSWNLTGYWTASSGGYKVINADGTFVDYNSNVSTYLNNATPSTWKKTSATTLYAQWTQDPTISLSLSSSTAVRGDAITLTAATTNASTPTIVYEYSTSSTFASAVTSIASTTSTSQSWTVPAGTSGTTYYLRAKMTISSTTYYSDILSLTAYGKKTIKVKDTNNWGANFKIHRWGGSADATEWPGETTNITSAGGQWKQVVLLSSSTNFLFCNGETTSTADANKTANQTYDGMSDDGCYEIATGPGGSLALTSTANCPAKPTVTASAATSKTNTTATMNGNISSNGNDNITDYGFYWSTTYTTAAALQSSGTKVQKGTSNYTGSLTHGLTGLTAATTVYYIAFATNGQGTTLSSVQNFVVPYSVTITKPTGCSSITPAAGTYYYATGFEVTTVAATGYTFDSWSTSNGATSSASSPSTGTNKVTFTPSANSATIQPVYEEDMHTVTLNSTYGGGHVEIGGETVTSTSAGIATASPTITAVPALGYYFTGWTGNIGSGVTIASGSTSTASITIRATADSKSITANFARRWVLAGEWLKDGGGAWDYTTNTFYPYVGGYGRAQVSDLAANTEYAFKLYDNTGATHWVGYATSGQVYDYDTYRAVSPADSILVNTYPGENITLKTAAKGNYSFYYNFNSHKLYVYFPQSRKISMGTYTKSDGISSVHEGGTISAEDNDENEITDGLYVSNNGSVTFTATPKAGYIWQGWYSNRYCTGVPVATDRTHTVSSITSDVTRYALFEETLYSVKVHRNDAIETIYKVGIDSHPTINAATAPTGKIFDRWVTTGSATVEDPYASTTKITGATDDVSTVTATFKDLPKIYIDMTSATGWNPTNMYVVFYKDGGYFDTNNGTGTSSTYVINALPLEMTKMDVAGKNIWYYSYDPTSGDFEDKTITCVTFIDHTYAANYGNFTSATAVYRTDFSSCMNMFVVTDNTGTNKNTTCYYRNTNAIDGTKGYWRKYEENNSGFYLNNLPGGSVEFTNEDGGNTYSARVNLDANTTYHFYLGCCNGWNWSNDKTTKAFNSDNRTRMVQPYDNVSSDDYRCQLTTTAAGYYTFTITPQNTREVQLSIDFPVAANDYRAVYNNAASSPTVSRPSNIIKNDQNSGTISLWLNKGTNYISFQKATLGAGGAVSWTACGSQQTVTGVAEAGIYTMTLTRDGSTYTVSTPEKYEGDLYIRTDCAPGKWADYTENKLDENTFNFSATDPNTFDYYYCKWVNDAGTNVRCVIANDINVALSDTLKSETILGGGETLPEGANIRFSYNSVTNTLKRSYLTGASTDVFLNIMPDAASKVYKTDGTTDMYNGGVVGATNKFSDLGNWVYEVDVKVYPGAKAAVKANYNSTSQSLIAAGTTLLGGTEETLYQIRLIYDFRTNYLMSAWMPDGDVDDPISLNSDIMIVRRGQRDANQLSFSDDGELTDVKRAYGVFEFRKTDMVNNMGSWNDYGYTYGLCMYYFSLPFDVNVSDIFGVGTMGDDWRIQFYNGKKRAEKGWFAGDGTTTFWEDVPADTVLYAYEGYLLMLNRSHFNNGSHKVWNNVTTSAYLYFPSTEPVYALDSIEKPITVPSHECTIDRFFTQDSLTYYNKETKTWGKGARNHKYVDSHWNMMGTPLFRNKAAKSLTECKVKIGEADSTLNYVYEWVPSTNSLSARQVLNTSFTFKPMFAYMVQYSGTVTFEGAAIKPAVIAARRTSEHKQYTVELELTKENQFAGRTYIELRENAVDSFLLNEDMYMMKGSKVGDIYTHAGGYEVAANVLTVNSHVVPVSVDTKSAGTYTISMLNYFSGTVTLIDKFANTRTDLGIEDYEIYLEKGTISDRFELEININKMPTAIDGVEDGQGTLKDGKAHKYIENGQMYILQNGMIYDAQGKRVK